LQKGCKEVGCRWDRGLFKCRKYCSKRGWAQNRKRAEIRPRVCGDLEQADRGFEGNSGGQVAAIGPTEAVGTQETGEKTQSGRGYRANSGSRDAGKMEKDTVGSRQKG
jgi:hypothetical protein